MDRKDFIIACGKGCLGVLIATPLLNGCTGMPYYDASISGSTLVVPLSAFAIDGKGETRYRKYVVARNDLLRHPVCVYRFSASDYVALAMRCPHQGAELQVFGDRLQCPAHGSEFTNRGNVRTGPADRDLRAFPVHVNESNLNIDLS